MNASILVFLYACHITHMQGSEIYLVWLNFQDLVLSILWRKSFLYSHTILNSLLFLL